MFGVGRKFSGDAQRRGPENYLIEDEVRRNSRTKEEIEYCG